MKKKINIRLFVQILFFAVVGVISTNNVLLDAGKGIGWLPQASLHAICPFGGVETFFSIVTLGVWVKKVHESSVVFMGIILLLTVILGPVFCGWVCPLGSIQEWFGKIGRKLFGKRYNQFIPRKADKYLRYLRYISLILVVYLSTQSLKLVFQDVDPYYALFKFWTSEIAIGSIMVLIATLVLSLFVERPWCKYACPYGALLGIFNLFRIFKIKRNTPTCISCKKCSNTCPMNIEVDKNEIIRDHQCISCMECTSENSCPVTDTVTLSVGKGGKS